MYRLIHTICFFCSFSILLLAQPFAGQKFIAGSLSFSKGSTDTPGSEQSLDDLFFSMNPEAGVMLHNRTALSIGIFFNRSVRTAINTSDQSNEQFRNGYGTSMTLRRFFPLAEKLGLYLQGGIAYSWSNGKVVNRNNTVEDTRNEFKENTFSVGLNPGIYYFVSDRIALEASFASLGFSNTKRKLEHANTSASQNSNGSQFSLSGNTQLSFGIRYYWGPQVLFKPIKS